MSALPKNQAIVLAAMRTADEISARIHTRDWPELPSTDCFAREVIGIHQDVRFLNRFGRVPSERQVHDALQQLVKKGLVRKNRIEGMGGGTTLYIRETA